MIALILLKILFLSTAIVYGCSNLIKVGMIFAGKPAYISNAQMWLMGIGIAGYIVVLCI